MMEYTPVYPDGMAWEVYEAALEKCVMGGGWLFNQSHMDVWFDFEGFVVKVPAGTRVRPDLWENTRRLIEDMYTEEHYGCPYPVARNASYSLAATSSISSTSSWFSPRTLPDIGACAMGDLSGLWRSISR